MTKHSALARSAGALVFDLVALLLALPLAHRAYGLVFLPTTRLPPLDELGLPLAVALVLWGIAASLTRVYERPDGTLAGSETARVLVSLALVGLAAAAVAFFSKDALSRLLILLFLACAAVVMLGHRVLGRLVAHVARRRGPGARRYAVVGTGGLAREIVDTIAAHREWGFALAGFVELDEDGARSRGPVLGKVSELGAILEREVLDRVIFAVPRDRLSALEAAIEQCELFGVEAQVSLGVFRHGTSRMTVEDLDGLPMLAFSRTPSDTVALAVKRAFDVAVSATVLLLLSPLLLALAVAIKLDSPGPVFFRQRRVGLNGRLFSMVKFRSMHVDAEARLEALLARNEMSGPVFKMRDDPRITGVGRFIRRASLDELPQFWNVLKGEMSVVGPRPPIPAEVRQYKRWQRRRLSVKPGITCSWQVSGRNEIDFDQWMELDLQYIDEWSLWRDVQICIQTIPAVFTSRGAR
ncbi:sugar transferase [Anaeromyxobacter oryzae]|uniref:UDP-phosphate galactose phosphotransferase n=1 Tax=Anaeromyxobacter oryzae TaxID=2918170 RepID=A0ABM7WYK4_9BACT|nr:sugar transferase [Anaeromyxobacter oryzae]BDG04616.1 UDP-phosphate galactose phosphotransferase [Anaeromyxobacter oryzae]